MSGISTIWVYLNTSPLLWLAVTIAAFLAAHFVGRKLGGSPLANSVLIAGAIIIALLLVSGTPYATYFEGAQFVPGEVTSETSDLPKDTVIRTVPPADQLLLCAARLQRRGFASDSRPFACIRGSISSRPHCALHHIIINAYVDL